MSFDPSKDFVPIGQLSKSRPKAWLRWTGGIDAACALRALRSTSELDVVGLFIDDVSDTVPRALMEEQAVSLNLPLHDDLETAESEGVSALAFACLASDESKQRGETVARSAGLEAKFPNWGEASTALARAIMQDGLRAVITRVDTELVSTDFLGRVLSEAVLEELPEGVDVCSESGALATFVCGGPMLHRPISPRLMNVVRDGRYHLAFLGPGSRRAYGDFGDY